MAKNYIIFDLEATCQDRKLLNNKRFLNETIEIGAVKITVDENGNPIKVGEFQIFIKPIVNKILTPFCRNLTSITQADVDNAPFFKEAIKQFKEFIGEDYVLCSWGNYDKGQFQRDCSLNKLNSEWTEKHINLKEQHGQILNRKPCGVFNALKTVPNATFDGTQHRGIDDARNIAKIFIHYFDKWTF